MNHTLHQNIGAVVLAAGRGKRMGCTDIPKVMMDIGNKPIISYMLDTLKKTSIASSHTVVVIGYAKEKLKAHIDHDYLFAEQTERLGTAHAAYVGMKTLPKEVTHVLVLGGDDSAFYRAETLDGFVHTHIANDCMLSLLTARVDDPAQYGRIVRHENDDIEIIEKEYVTPAQADIHEISTGTFCFNRAWFEAVFPRMPKLRKLDEYGLPTALAIARNERQKHQVVMLEDSNEWFGINTKEELEEADRRKLNIKY